MIDSTRVISGRSDTPSEVATTWTSSSAEAALASSHSHAPSGKRGRSSAATWRASRVLPTPPTPVTVTSRDDWSASATQASSSWRPTNELAVDGRLVGKLSSERSGGKRSSPSWKTRWGPERSRSRCSPRSTSVTPPSARSSAVAAESTIWPPWATAIMRAARLTVGPK